MKKNETVQGKKDTSSRDSSGRGIQSQAPDKGKKASDRAEPRAGLSQKGGDTGDMDRGRK